MRLKLNGKDREVQDAATVEDLVAQLGIHRAIVVEHNGVILQRDDYAESALREGDVIEIVHFVGGGAGV
jgi:thiamine biosynthesis protein ThiS